MGFPAKQSNFKIGYKNVGGLHNNNGCKIPDLLTELNNDVEVISETWGCTCKKQFNGYRIVAESNPQKHEHVKKGRKSGGIIVLVKPFLANKIKVLKVANNFVWLEISKCVTTGLDRNLLLACTYIHDVSSTYFDQNVFEELSSDISTYCDHETPLIITGDMNARTGCEDDFFVESATWESIQIQTPNNPHL